MFIVDILPNLGYLDGLLVLFRKVYGQTFIIKFVSESVG